MLNSNKSVVAWLITFSILLPGVATAQDFNFNILPLAINPAFTGLFDGRIRANSLDKRAWSSPRASFSAIGASADAVIIKKNGNYLAAGLACLEGRTDNRTLDNFSGIASVAYHKAIKAPGSKRSEIALGLQGGYIRRNLNIPDFSNSVLPYVNRIGIGNTYFVVNAGISFSQVLGRRLSYTIGLAGNNLNLINDGTVHVENPLLRITPSATGMATANWAINDRVTFRPAVLHIINEQFYVAGNEFRYTTSHSKPLHTAFLGVWYRTGDVLTISPGYEFGCFRIGGGIDYYLHSARGNGGAQLVVRYIVPNTRGSGA